MHSRRLANAAALLVAAGFVVGAVLYNRSLGSQAEVGKVAPSFELEALDGQRVQLAAFRGRPVLVNFWTTWCDPCRDEIPGLETFFRRFGDRMSLIGVNVREPLAAVRDFAFEFGMTYPVVRDVDGRVSERYRLRGYPESWLIGPDGVARRYWPGPITFEQLEQAYQEVMGRPITAGLDDGGPLPAGEAGVGLVAVSGRLFVAGTHRLLSAPAGPGRERPDSWQAVALPEAGAVSAVAAWPERRRLAVAVGTGIWLYDLEAGRWAQLARAPAPVLSLSPTGSGEGGQGLLAWLKARGLVKIDASGRLEEVPARGLPLPAEQAWAGQAGAWVAAATPVGLLRAKASPLNFQATRLSHPSFAVLALGDGWLVATDRGVYRYDPQRDEAAPVPGTPVRTFVALAPVGAEQVAALASGGDFYIFVPGARDGAWQAAPIPR
ncbi:MAG: TlpA disulfide reductase family protein [Bacillota bacterium]